jgi:hypothetical protein
MLSAFVLPVKRFVHGKNIIAQVPAKVLLNDGLTVKVKMYDLEKPLTFTPPEFAQFFQPFNASEELLRDFDVISFTEGGLRAAAGALDESVKGTMEEMIGKCVMDSYKSCGNAKSCPIETYKRVITATAATLESYKPQFNRRARNTFVIPPDFDEDAFQKDPLPVGVDAHEFATKAEQNAICRKLVTQLYGFAGAPPMSDAMQTLLDLPEKPVAGTHTCKYCCKPMELSKVAQKYKAKEHYLNLCHDDPERGTRADNVYWGHTSCNREQGGCSMFQRVLQGLQLATRTKFTEEQQATLRPLVAALKVSLGSV